MNKERLREVIAAVKETPAELLIAGSPVNREGCVCAIGAWVYAHDPIVKAIVDELRIHPLSDESVFYAVGESYQIFRRDLDDAPGYGLTREVYLANDKAYKANLDAKPEERKAAILASLQKLVA